MDKNIKQIDNFGKEIKILKVKNEETRNELDKNKKELEIKKTKSSHLIRNIL